MPKCLRLQACSKASEVTTMAIMTATGVIREQIVGSIRKAVLLAVHVHKPSSISVSTQDENGPILQSYDSRGQLLEIWRQPSLMKDPQQLQETLF